MLLAGNINDESTTHFLVETMIKYARHEDEYPLLVHWFENDLITNHSGTRSL